MVHSTVLYILQVRSTSSRAELQAKSKDEDRRWENPPFRCPRGTELPMSEAVARMTGRTR